MKTTKKQLCILTLALALLGGILCCPAFASEPAEENVLLHGYLTADVYYIGNDCHIDLAVANLASLNYIEAYMTTPASLELIRDTPFIATDEGNLTLSLIWSNPDEEYWRIEWRRSVSDEDGLATIAELTFAMGGDFAERAINIHVAHCVANLYETPVDDVDLTVGIGDGTPVALGDAYDGEAHFLIAALPPEGASAIVATYAPNGRMVGIHRQQVAPSSAAESLPGLAIIAVTLSDGEAVEGNILKLFLLDAGFAPLGSATTIEYGFCPIPLDSPLV